MGAPPILVAFGVPLIILLCGAMGRKLTRATPWERHDFYLGLQLTLAAFSTDLLFLVEVLRNGTDPAIQARATGAAVFLAFAFALYVLQLTLHQDWESRSTEPRRQNLRLMLGSNLIGIALLAGFVFVVKGVR